MQHVAVHLSHFSSRGGRVSSPALRHSQQLSEDFAGLPAGTDRYDLLLLVKKAGRAAGFTPRMIQLLDYYFAFTRDSDWERGSRPVVYQSLAKTALDLSVTERQVQRLEQALFEAGVLTWNDSGNHRRHGQRCAKTGRILYAYGVDLSPLAALKGELEAKLQEKTLRDQAWLETKRQVSARRRQVCALLAEAEAGAERPAWLCEAAGRYEALAVPIRTYMGLTNLRELLAQTQALLSWLSEKASPQGDSTVVHYHSFTQESEESVGAAKGFQESVAAPSETSVWHRGNPNQGEAGQGEFGTGLQHLTPKQAHNAASERFRAHVPMHPRPVNWSDLVEAAYRLKPELRISQGNWGEACQTLGRHGAAVCLLLTDQAMLRPDDPVRQPGAYFRAMVNRAHTGELNLQGSVFGILKREEGMNATAADAGQTRRLPPGGGDCPARFPTAPSGSKTAGTGVRLRQRSRS